MAQCGIISSMNKSGKVNSIAEHIAKKWKMDYYQHQMGKGNSFAFNKRDSHHLSCFLHVGIEDKTPYQQTSSYHYPLDQYQDFRQMLELTDKATFLAVRWKDGLYMSNLTFVSGLVKSIKKKKSSGEYKGARETLYLLIENTYFTPFKVYPPVSSDTYPLLT